MAPTRVDNSDDSDDDFNDGSDDIIELIRCIDRAQTKNFWDVLDSMDSFEIPAVRFCAYYWIIETTLANEPGSFTEERITAIRQYLTEIESLRWPNYEFSFNEQHPLMRVHYRLGDGASTPTSVSDDPCGSIYEKYINNKLFPN